MSVTTQASAPLSTGVHSRVTHGTQSSYPAAAFKSQLRGIQLINSDHIPNTFAVSWGNVLKRPDLRCDHTLCLRPDKISIWGKKEENRYRELLLLERAGLIRSLELQPRYDLVVNGHKLGFYRGDFRYEEVATGTLILEDVKSPVTKTAVYQLKKKLVKALYGIEIREV